MMIFFELATEQARGGRDFLLRRQALYLAGFSAVSRTGR